MFQGLIHGFRDLTTISNLERRFDEVLDLTEQCFGIRDDSFSILRVEYLTNNDGPRAYPDFQNNTLIIYLSASVSGLIAASVYEFAHEIVHCLRPAQRDDVKYLEEGIASYNSKLIMEHFGWGYQAPTGINAHEIKLLNAFADFESLFISDNEVISRIQAGNINKISSITPLQITQNLNDVLIGEDILQRLDRLFY